MILRPVPARRLFLVRGTIRITVPHTFLLSKVSHVKLAIVRVDGVPVDGEVGAVLWGAASLDWPPHPGHRTASSPGRQPQRLGTHVDGLARGIGAEAAHAARLAEEEVNLLVLGEVVAQFGVRVERAQQQKVGGRLGRLEVKEAHFVTGGAVAARNPLFPFLGWVGLVVRCGQGEEEQIAGGAAVASAMEWHFSWFHTRSSDIEMGMKASKFYQFDVYILRL